MNNMKTVNRVHIDNLGRVTLRLDNGFDILGTGDMVTGERIVFNEMVEMTGVVSSIEPFVADGQRMALIHLDNNEDDWFAAASIKAWSAAE